MATRPGIAPVSTAHAVQRVVLAGYPVDDVTGGGHADGCGRVSEYGASIGCDPYTWIPEAARLLRPGGQLIFLVNSAAHAHRPRQR